MSTENENLKKGDPLHEIITRPICVKLEEERIFSINKNTNYNDIFLMEMCDEYYGYYLTKQDCKDLEKVFHDLAEIVEG